MRKPPAEGGALPGGQAERSPAQRSEQLRRLLFRRHRGAPPGTAEDLSLDSLPVALSARSPVPEGGDVGRYRASLSLRRAAAAAPEEVLRGGCQGSWSPSEGEGDEASPTNRGTFASPTEAAAAASERP